MAVDIPTLTNELNTDPLVLGYAPWITQGNTGELANLLNAQIKTVTKPIPVNEVLKFTANTGILLRLDSAKGNTGKSDKARASALAVFEFIRSPHTKPLDVGDTSISGIITELVTQGVITVAEKDAFIALSQQPGSRAEELFGIGTSVSYIDVAQALGN
jgi:hypothetical protein